MGLNLSPYMEKLRQELHELAAKYPAPELRIIPEGPGLWRVDNYKPGRIYGDPDFYFSLTRSPNIIQAIIDRIKKANEPKPEEGILTRCKNRLVELVTR